MSGYTFGDRLRRRFQRRIVKPFSERVVVPTRRWRNRNRFYTPVFVAGTMGSGTTLMALSLAQRYRCAGVATESGHQIERRSFLHVRHPHDFATVADYLESLAPRSDWEPRDGADALQRMYRGRATGDVDAEVIVDKGPNVNLVRAGFLRRCFPDSWFVLVYRDPVVNVEGFRRKWAPFSSEPLEASIRFYEETHRRFLEQAEELGDRLLGISYEELVARYDDALGAIAAQIGLESSDSQLQLEKRPNVPGQGVRNVSRGRIGLVTDANQRAYADLDAAEVEQIRSRLEPVYEELESRFRLD